MKEAMFYEKLKDKKVHCRLCAFNCVISDGEVGRCRVRKDIDGKLYSLVYDKVSTIVVNPIEKKPLYHFFPGSSCLSLSTVGCNWRCKFCCNWEISSAGEIEGEKKTPEEIVKMAIENGCQGLSFTFTEPTIFYELSYETAKIAHKKGLYNTWVSNGYTNKEPIRKIAPYLDAVTIDFKGSGEEKFLKEFSDVPSNKPIYEALKEYKKVGVHIEITDLIVPQIGDSMEELKKLVKWIRENLGEETPFHILKFFPTYLVRDLPMTPIETLEKAYEIAKSEGLKYVYLGNLEGEKNNTYCPKCGKLLIVRAMMETLENKIKKSKCPFCGKLIKGLWGQ
ncbi:AmmeMemoRadiSam system radical SAM enzyme [bacterium (Candidatus Moisslbacteria) CG_4_9_14_0_8_um_filter_36_20]|nr:MAG: AmmeMemoRadiSam system radical SAM enzyme [bacterium (Candidatus Moisslbacteria) CG_4_9_14_0_8_um_filter_36_20]